MRLVVDRADDIESGVERIAPFRRESGVVPGYWDADALSSVGDVFSSLSFFSVRHGECTQVLQSCYDCDFLSLYIREVV